MAELTYTLGEHPQIIELLSVLEKNNLQKQKEEVQALVGYIDGMEDKLAQMNYFADAEEMVSTYGEESANRLFRMGAAYYYLIDNAVQGAPAGAGETVEGHTESQAAETTAP